jgi:hypothetical protein
VDGRDAFATWGGMRASPCAGRKLTHVGAILSAYAHVQTKLAGGLRVRPPDASAQGRGSAPSTLGTQRAGAATRYGSNVMASSACT